MESWYTQRFQTPCPYGREGSIPSFDTNKTHGDCSLIGKAPDCDSGHCEFDSRHSPYKEGSHNWYWSALLRHRRESGYGFESRTFR